MSTGSHLTGSAGTPGLVPEHHRSALARWSSTILWWAATLLTLMVLDDLTFGPFFWVISRVGGAWVAMALALAIYIPVQLVIVWHGTSDHPGRFASFFLKRLDLERRSSHVAEREQRMHQRVTGVVSAVPLSLVIGGVLPPLVLWRNDFSTSFVRRLSIVTATVYAVEFALIHGLVPSLI